MEYVGEIAALAAASCWVVTALVLASAGRHVGATIVNAIRIWIAIAILLLLVKLNSDTFWPQVSPSSLYALALSGLIGLAIGDQFLYRALIDAGPRLSTLTISITPALTAILALLVLGETLDATDVLGMVLTIIGIGIAVVPTKANIVHKTYPNLYRGIVFAFLGAIGQALGLVLAKIGMQGGELPAHSIPITEVSPLSATYIRMCFGGIGATLMLLIYLVFRSKPRAAINIRLNKTQVLIFIGAIFGPVLGVWLGLISVKNINAGVAATLMGISPILIIPFSRIFEKEAVTKNGIIGALLSTAGVAILFLF